jgi:ubiquinone/menaquinone biosynthesis C-methylase UbiE
LSEQYHLGELRIALDPANPRHILPPPLPPGARILDVGCGAGQTLIAAYPDRACFGIDIDFDALKLGRSLDARIGFANAAAEALPFAGGQFDLVCARVSLPYTNIPRSLKEIRRVLKKGGQAWLTLHPISLPWSQVPGSNYKGKIFFLYVVLNSLALHVAGRQFPFLGRYESFQTSAGITRALERSGFEAVAVKRGAHFLATAQAK